MLTTYLNTLNTLNNVSIVQGNGPAVYVPTFINLLETNNGSRQETPHKSMDLSNINKYPKRNRTHIIPVIEKRCIATTKNGEQCKCYKKNNSQFCVTHSNTYDVKDKPEVAINPKIVVKKSGYFNWLWKRLF